MAVQRSGFQSGGHLPWVRTQICLHSAAAGQQRTNLHTLPDINTAGSLRPQKTLMAGEAENIDLHAVHIKIEHTGSLGGIHNVDKLVFPGDGTDSFNIQQITCQIGTVGCDDCYCVRADFFLKVFVTEVAESIRGKDGQFYPLIFQLEERSEDRIVLQCGGNNMVTGMQYTLDRHIQRFCGIGGKRNAIRTFRTKQLGKCRTGIINDSRSAESTVVHTASGISQRTHCFRHSLHHAIRFFYSSGSIVEINHSITSDLAVIDTLRCDMMLNH